MLGNSRLVRGVARRIAEERINAERAVQMTRSTRSGEGFAAMGDAYLAARVEDIRVVGSRLIRNLTKTPYAALQRCREGAVILAEELTPADTALMDPRRVAGFATVLGGAESHTAIMARALGLPAVLGIAGLLDQVDRATRSIIDGGEGAVILDPTPATIAALRGQRATIERARAALARLRRLPAVTRDGVEISAAGQSRTAARARPGGSPPARGGIGLLRTRIPLHEPRRSARRGRAVRGLCAGWCAAWTGGR